VPEIWVPSEGGKKGLVTTGTVKHCRRLEKNKREKRERFVAQSAKVGSPETVKTGEKKRTAK